MPIWHKPTVMDADGKMTWAAAVAWTDQLTLGGYTDWSLPTTVPALSGDNQKGSQMGNLFYTQLGGVAGTDIATTHNANYDLFKNVKNSVYLSSSEYAPNPNNYSWTFYTENGNQYGNYKGNEFYAWAVRSGDVSVAAVPVPGAFWLFGSAMIGLMGFKRRSSIG